jgi:hypothetical protein
MRVTFVLPVRSTASGDYIRGHWRRTVTLDGLPRVGDELALLGDDGDRRLVRVEHVIWDLASVGVDVALASLPPGANVRLTRELEAGRWVWCDGGRMRDSGAA